MQSLKSRLAFDVTNESLDAVVAGVDPSSSDTVLAVGGSGDQAFALLGYADRVIVVDSNLKQLELISQRRKTLEDPELFLLGTEGSFHAQARNSYFLDANHFERARANSDSLVVSPPMDFFQFFSGAFDMPIDGVYLSNVMGYGLNPGDFFPRDQELLDLMGSSLQDGTRVYITNANETLAPGKPYTVPDTFVVDTKRTNLARALEERSPLYELYHWQPTVFNIKK